MALYALISFSSHLIQLQKLYISTSEAELTIQHSGVCNLSKTYASIQAFCKTIVAMNQIVFDQAVMDATSNPRLWTNYFPVFYAYLPSHRRIERTQHRHLLCIVIAVITELHGVSHHSPKQLHKIHYYHRIYATGN